MEKTIQQIIDIMVQDIPEDKMADKIANLLNNTKEEINYKNILKSLGLLPSKSLVKKVTEKLNDDVKSSLEDDETEDSETSTDEEVSPEVKGKETQQELSERLKAIQLINEACKPDNKSHLMAIDEKRLLQVLDNNFENITPDEADHICKLFNKLAYSKTVDNSIKTLFKTLSSSLSKYRKSMTMNSDNMVTVTGVEEGAAKSIPVVPQAQSEETDQDKEVSAAEILSVATGQKTKKNKK